MRSRKVLLLPVIAILASGYALADSAPPKPGDVELGVQLEAESGKLQQLKQQLDLMEQRTKEEVQRQQGRAAAGNAFPQRTLADAPASVVTENLRVERAEGDNGLAYTVSARNASLLQILEAVAKTAALPLETHPDVPHDRLLSRMWLDLNGVEMLELLQIVAGTQSLDVMADANGIVVAPLTALSDKPPEKRLRELAVEAYQTALFKYPSSVEAPPAYLGIARHYAASGFHTAAIQVAQNILDRWPKAPAGASALLLIGNCHEALREYDAARKSYYRYVDLYPAAEALPSVLVTIGETWMKEQKWSQAIPLFEEAAKQWPKSDQAPIARMRLAECFAAQQHYEQAVAQLERVERDYVPFPRKDELNLAIAECQMKLKQFGRARVRLKEVFEKSPDAALAERAIYTLGDSLLEEAKPLAAVEVCYGAMRQFPEGALIRRAPLRLSRAYLQMGLHSKAEQVLKTLPDSSADAEEIRPILLTLAHYHLQNGKHERVLALMADPRWPHSHDAEPEVLLLWARALLGSGLTEPALEKATLAATLAADEETRAEACRVIGECDGLKKESVRAAMAYGGKTE